MSKCSQKCTKVNTIFFQNWCTIRKQNHTPFDNKVNVQQVSQGMQCVEKKNSSGGDQVPVDLQVQSLLDI